MKSLRAAPAILFLAGLLFAYGCDCTVSGGPANSAVCVLGPDDVPFAVCLDANGDGGFTPAEGAVVLITKSATHSCSISVEKRAACFVR